MKAGGTFGIVRAQPVTADEPDLARIRANHPGWEIKRVEGEVWQALRQRWGGWEHAIYREQIRDIEAALDLLSEDGES
jgi:hypothetical protein